MAESKGDRQVYYNISRNHHFRKDYGLSNQIQRAAVSVPSNVGEGFERGSKEELIHFLYMARGSAGEVRTQLAIAQDLSYITKAEYENLKNECLSVSKQINGFIEYLKGSKTKGDKFRRKKDKEK
ncbi:MAG: four helix bundle protein [Nitrospinota bacterium]